MAREGEDCRGFEEDCRLNPDTPALITHTAVATCLRKRKTEDD